jgi:hypothetical protein
VPPARPTTIYFAEGYTGRFATNGRADFDEFISVLNPDNFAKTVTLTYQIQGRAVPLIRTVQVGANSDLLESVNADVGPDQILSTAVSANYYIAAERVINRATPLGALDADSSLGNTAAGTAWYFAEGYTGATFQEYLTVQNPVTSTARVTVTFLPQGAARAAPRTVGFVVPALGRATENIRRDNAGGQPDVGMMVTSDQPIVAERVEYWGEGVGSAKYGASAEAGMSEAAKRFYVAFGSNPGANPANAGPAQQPNDESYVTVVNPSTAAGATATVTATFYAMTGMVLGSRTFAVAPQTRQTLIVSSVLGAVAGPYWTMVAADQPIFVEQPQYFGGSPNVGRHPGEVLAGAPDGVGAVLFPKLDTAAAAGTPISETVFLLNPGTTPLTVIGTYYAPAGQTVTVGYTVGAGSLRVVNVNADAAGLPAGPFGAQYRSAGVPIVATRIGRTPDGLSYIGSQGVPY